MFTSARVPNRRPSRTPRPSPSARTGPNPTPDFRHHPSSIDIGASENQSQLFTLTPPSAIPARMPATPPGSTSARSPNSGPTSNLWTVDVNWGDGSSDTVFSTTRQGSLGSQTHTYTTAGSPTVTVTINDVDNNFAQMMFGVTVVQLPTFSDSFARLPRSFRQVARHPVDRDPQRQRPHQPRIPDQRQRRRAAEPEQPGPEHGDR